MIKPVAHKWHFHWPFRNILLVFVDVMLLFNLVYQWFLDVLCLVILRKEQLFAEANTIRSSSQTLFNEWRRPPHYRNVMRLTWQIMKIFNSNIKAARKNNAHLTIQLNKLVSVCFYRLKFIGKPLIKSVSKGPYT